MCTRLVSLSRSVALVFRILRALLSTLVPKHKGFPVFALTPPTLLFRLGLAKEGELWLLTPRAVRPKGISYAVVGLQGLPPARPKVNC